MRRILIQGVLSLTASLLLAGGAYAQRNPVGEKADYDLDRNSSRTSGLIQRGTMTAAITQALPDADGGPAYEGKVDYEFRISIIGNRSGTEYVNVPATFFTPEFMEELRRTGHYESPQFKMDHEGYANARNMDGRTYNNCDKVKIYDIDQGSASMLFQIAAEMIAGDANAQDEIEDLVIKAHVYTGVPVLGAVKLDISGKYNGINIKAGADYKAP